MTRRSVGTRHARCSVLLPLVLLAGCATALESDWQAKLEHRLASDLAPPDPTAVPALPVDADPASGDRVCYAITLHDGARTKSWQLALTIGKVATQRLLEWRALSDFEQRVVVEGTERDEPDVAEAAFVPPPVDYEQLLREAGRDVAVAALHVEAFAGDGTHLGTGESSVQVERLRRGLLPACRAGHRHRERMRGRVAAGMQAPVLTVDAATAADLQTVAIGVDACASFFRLLQCNPVTRQILGEVLALPSLWSILTHWGVRITFQIDFFAAERLDPAQFPGETRELWSVPVVLLLNGQPGFLASVVIGPSGSPDGAAAGIYGLVAQHPSDAERRVVVRMAAVQRGAPAGEAGN